CRGPFRLVFTKTAFGQTSWFFPITWIRFTGTMAFRGRWSFLPIPTIRFSTFQRELFFTIRKYLVVWLFITWLSPTGLFTREQRVLTCCTENIQPILAPGYRFFCMATNGKSLIFLLKSLCSTSKVLGK